jgi:hypothetical protein
MPLGCNGETPFGSVAGYKAYENHYERLDGTRGPPTVHSEPPVMRWW